MLQRQWLSTCQQRVSCILPKYSLEKRRPHYNVSRYTFNEICAYLSQKHLNTFSSPTHINIYRVHMETGLWNISLFSEVWGLNTRLLQSVTDRKDDCQEDTGDTVPDFKNLLSSGDLTNLKTRFPIRWRVKHKLGNRYIWRCKRRDSETTCGSSVFCLEILIFLDSSPRCVLHPEVASLVQCFTPNQAALRLG